MMRSEGQMLPHGWQRFFRVGNICQPGSGRLFRRREMTFRKWTVRIFWAFSLLWSGLVWPWQPTEAGGLPRVDRQWMQRFEQAQQKIAQGHLMEAIPILEELITSRQKGYLRIEELGGLHIPLQRAAAMLVESLPAEGQATLEAWCGAKAAQRLEKALLQRSADGLIGIVQDYPGSRYAAEAALILAADAYDRGRWEATIRWAEKAFLPVVSSPTMKQQACLLAGAASVRLGQSELARQWFAQLVALGPTKQLRLGATGVGEEASVDRWMAVVRSAIEVPEKPGVSSTRAAAAWPMFRGEPSRNGSATWDSQIGSLRWHLDTPLGSGQQSNAKVILSTNQSLFSNLFPAIQPVLGEGLALVRLPTRLVAVDLWTGRQRWEYPWGGYHASEKTDDPQLEGFAFPTDRLTSSRQLQLYFQRMYNDIPYGHITVQGSRLFMVDGLGMVVSWMFAGPMPIPLGLAGGRPGDPNILAPSPHNRLLALDLTKDGKVLWSVGGASGEDEPALAGAFFLGPPVWVEGLLYALVEQEEEIRVVALEDHTGHLVWSLPIAVPERPITSDPLRRLAGAMPSYADGVLVCPTSAGAVVAVDPWSRMILWAQEIPLAEFPQMHGVLMPFFIRPRPASSPDQLHTSRDGTAILAPPCALISPVESDQLFCFDLATGRLCWARQIEQFLYVAAVAEQIVLTVGTKSFSAWQLLTGKPAWEELALPLPEGYTPAGFGFRQGNDYYLPISNGEESQLLAIDILTGQVKRRWEPPTKSRIGNIAALGSTLISVSADAVEAFGPEKP